VRRCSSLSAQYPRYGYRRIRVFLRRRGFELSWSRTHRLWRQAGLLVRRKRSRKRIASMRPRMRTPFKGPGPTTSSSIPTATGQQLKCLSVEWFRSGREAKVVIESWRQHYNEVRPHSSLQYLTATELKQQLRQDLQPAGTSTSGGSKNPSGSSPAPC